MDQDTFFCSLLSNAPQSSILYICMVFHASRRIKLKFSIVQKISFLYYKLYQVFSFYYWFGTRQRARQATRPADESHSNFNKTWRGINRYRVAATRYCVPASWRRAHSPKNNKRHYSTNCTFRTHLSVLIQYTSAIRILTIKIN